MPDEAAVEQLVNHRYFQADVTPLQILNRATDPFLPIVRPHTWLCSTTLMPAVCEIMCS